MEGECKIKEHKIVILALTAISTLLIIIGMIIPPIGVVDGSILVGIGELFAFGLLWEIPEYLKAKKDIKVTKGDTTIEINNDNDQLQK